MSVEQLWNGVGVIGGDEGEPIAPEVIAELVRLKIVRLADDKPELTDYGWRLFTILESGDGDVPPELDERREW